MRAKVTKYHSFAIQASTGKRYDPKLHLNGENIPFIGNKTVKFLEVQSQFPTRPRSIEVWPSNIS